ncbi:MAG: alcohol dehydrogenase catalytic domain-containing protein [Oligoflexia bacterium]|nr:alcohol dehydrogenase catalytic domain-containing protein [Oligoflexia bacterium]
MMMSLKFAAAKRQAYMSEVAIPEVVRPTDVRVRILLSGVCGTDINIFRGRFNAQDGIIVGHEAIGLVDELGAAVRGLELNQRVLIDPTFFCGICDWCRQGYFHVCNHKQGTEVGIDYDGTHAEYTIIPGRFLYPLPATISDERAVLIEPLACVLNNVRAANITANDRVLILGGGPIGLIFAMYCQRFAHKVVLVEKNEKRATLAASILSAETVTTSVPTAGSGADAPTVVVDTVGNMADVAFSLLEKRGRLLIMGFDQNYQARIPTLQLVGKAISIIGAGDYNGDMPRAIALAGEFPLERLITHRIALPESAAFMNQFVADIVQGKNVDVMKALFIP